MSEGTVERTREGDADAESTDLADAATAVDVGADLSADGAGDAASGSYFSLRAQIVAFVAIGAGMTLGSLVPILPFTSFVGIPLGAFVHGLLDRERRYVETVLAGGLLAGLAVVSSLLPQLLAGFDGTRLFAIAAAVGTALALLGHYFGRDLRDGLTRDL